MGKIKQLFQGLDGGQISAVVGWIEKRYSSLATQPLPEKY